VCSPFPQPYIVAHAIAIITATPRVGTSILATLPVHPDGCPNKPVFAGRRGSSEAGESVQPVQPSLHFDSVPPRTPNLWPEAKERGTQVVGANPAVIREKRRLFQR
jgi:hypothetical protein